MTKYELDNIPASTAGKRMYARVSPVYDNSYFVKSWYDVIGKFWDKYRPFAEKLREQHFIETVDYGIEYLEHKYSLEPRPDLSLEERRARLGLKATRKFPLNPAILEKYALDNYGLRVYLDESDPGYIHMILNSLTEHGMTDWVKFLLREKPAHLALDGLLNLIIYLGTGGEPIDDKKIYKLGEIPIPTTPSEVKKYPRIYAGIYNYDAGLVTQSIAKPKSAAGKVSVGVAQFETGLKGGVSIAKPKGYRQKIYVGAKILMGGEFTLGAQPVPPPELKKIRECGIADILIADAGLARPAETPALINPPKPKIKIRVGHATMLTGEITLKTRQGENALADLPTGNWIKLYFTFPVNPDHVQRTVLLPNPREDLTRDDIIAVGKYAADNKILMNSAGEYVTGISKAAFKTVTTRKIIL